MNVYGSIIIRRRALIDCKDESSETPHSLSDFGEVPFDTSTVTNHMEINKIESTRITFFAAPIFGVCSDDTGF
jgi:hypothetical protein